MADVYQYSDEPTGTHWLLLERVPKGSRVLDVGCASGYLGHYLVSKKECQVWGIEPNVERANAAEQKGYTYVYTGAVEEMAADDEIVGQTYDVILIGDVLEHLMDPVGVLKVLQQYLAPEGRFVISLPNVAHYSVRFSLLFGRWDYTDAGIMDRTHVHFYTKETAGALLDRAGLVVDQVVGRGDIERWGRKIGLGWLGSKIERFFPGICAVQYIFVARKKAT